MDNLKKAVLTPKEAELAQVVMVSMESFRQTHLTCFLDLAKDALDKIYSTIHALD